jgi:hypothetical protein
MLNRVNHFIKNITFNSGLNREKFINNKKIVNKITNKNKNNNMIIVRKMSTYREPFYKNTKINNDNKNTDNNNTDNNNNNNNNNNNILYMFIMASGVYISHTYNNRKSKKIYNK